MGLATSRATPASGRRALGLVEVLVGLGLAGLLGSMALPRLKPATTLLYHQAAMHDLTATLRAVRFRALTQHRVFHVRIDAAQGGFCVMAQHQNSEGPIQIVERTIWLPPGLSVTEAPPVLTILPTGELSEGSIIVASTAHGTRFHLTTAPAGQIRLFEEPSL